MQSKEEIEKVSRLFEQEALLLAKLSHPSLPDIYDHFSHDGDYYFVMKYIIGETLSQRLHNMPGEYLPIDDTLEIGMNLCDVLDYLHAQTPPVIFGDLKPDNIMLTPEGNLYLIDFGIARLFEASLSDDRKFVSRGYSPPEQYLYTQISPRADIYSLGATLHQLLSGQHPAKDKNAFADLGLGYQPWARSLEVLILSMVESDEQQRPQHVTEVKQRLQNIRVQYEQELNLPTGTSARDGQSSGWRTPYGGYPPPYGQPYPTMPPYLPYSSDASSVVDVPPLPNSVTSWSIRLSLGSIEAQAWSPDGSYLAVANTNEIQIYTWPRSPEEREAGFDNQVLTPLRTWRKEDLLSPMLEQDFKAFTVYRPGPNLAWSPDSAHLAVILNEPDSLLCILDSSGEHVITIPVDKQATLEFVVWSPDGRFIATGQTYPSLVQIWEAGTGKKIRDHKLIAGRLTALTWSQDAIYIAMALFDGNEPTIRVAGADTNTTVLVCEAATGQAICHYDEHSNNINDILWAPDGRYIVSCGGDHTVQVWDPASALKLHSLEAHTDSVQRIAFLDNGRLLASVSSNGAVYIWKTDSWAQLESFNVSLSIGSYYGPPRFKVTFHPINPLMALFEITTPGDSAVISLYEIDISQLYLDPSKRIGVQYTNAKVVLIGDSGVGKSGLGLVLSRQGFAPTESTHGRVVWTFTKRENKLEDGRREIRETLLWDLAGQPGYRLIHQLHLSEVAVALVVFDAHSETDPFSGISHWVRALRTAQSVRGNMGAMKMLLVQSRIDRGGVRVTRDRIDEFVQKLGMDGYYETSAKEGTNISALTEAIKIAIDWEQLPKVTSTELFQRIRSFLIAEKQAGRILSSADDLYRTFQSTWPWGEKDFSAEFATGIKLLESTGLIRRLSFGNLVLLQPELLDTYASALINEARREPDGLGSIAEERVHAAAFSIPTDERIRDPEQEKLLLIAMVQDLLSYEVALREYGEDGPYLVFPSESTRENPDLPDPENASIVFTFKGPVRNIYATLAVFL